MGTPANPPASASEPAAPAAAAPVTTAAASPPTLARLEADLFCQACGHNLIHQGVWREPTTGLLVFRCPECGVYYPADTTPRPHDRWLRRLGAVLCVVWAVLVAVIAVRFLTELSRMQFAYLLATCNAADLLTKGYEVPKEFVPEVQLRLSFVSAISIADGLLAGGFFAVILCAQRRPVQFFPLAFPVFAAALTALAWWRTMPPEGLAWDTLGMLTLQQVAAVVVGLYLGRPVVRGLLRLIVPRSLLVHVAQLWDVDGKKLPA